MLNVALEAVPQQLTIAIARTGKNHKRNKIRQSQDSTYSQKRHKYFSPLLADLSPSFLSLCIYNLLILNS
jgi:hypothetical protein